MNYRLYLFIIISLLASNIYAQVTLLHRNKLTDSVTERFYVLKTNPEIRHGNYQAFFQKKQIIAIGNYNNGQKNGIWLFFDRRGQLIEKYNFNTKAITFEAPIKASDDLNYFFDDTLKSTDQLTRPLKIGGSYYGFIPYLTIFKLPFDTYELNTELINAYVELLISPLGRLASYRVYVRSDYYKYYQNFSLDVNLFNDEDKTFFSATHNNEPVLCRIIIKCSVNDEGGLDFF